MTRTLIAITFLLSAGVSFGQFKGPIVFESITYIKPEPLPAFYQKYMEWVIASNHHTTAISPELLFHRQQSGAPSIKWVNIPGRVKLQYAEQGDSSGIPVILLHGFTDSWRSYESVMPYLPASLHVYALSQRGHGDSERPDNYNPKEFAADINALMDELNIRRAIIVGHSMGATVAQRFAIDFPNRVMALVLEGSFASFRSNELVQQFIVTVNQLSDPIDRSFAREFQQSTLTAKIDSAYFEQLVDESMKLPKRVWTAVLNELITVEYLAELERVKKPCLIIWGDKDAFVTRNDQLALSKALANSRLIIYQGTGHSPHWEQPARFTNDIVEFATKYKIDIYE